jgi:predicted RNase H-like HicB family nuclease
MKWAIVIEKGKRNYGGYVPDLPGIGVAGDTPEEVKRLLTEAIEIYLQEEDSGIPEAACPVDYVEVSRPMHRELERKPF